MARKKKPKIEDDFEPIVTAPIQRMPPQNVRRGGMLDPRAELLDWSDGTPVLSQEPLFRKDTVQQIIGLELMREYTPPIDPETGQPSDVDIRYLGKTQLEAMLGKLVLAAADGIPSARQEVLDRFIGKPKQQVESVQMNMNYQQWLDYIADTVEDEPVQDEPIKHPIVNITPSNNDPYRPIEPEQDDTDDFTEWV